MDNLGEVTTVSDINSCSTVLGKDSVVLRKKKGKKTKLSNISDRFITAMWDLPNSLNEARNSVLKLDSKIKRKVNKELADKVHNQYYKELFPDWVYEVLGPFGLVMVSEDGSPFEAMFMGDKGRTVINISSDGLQKENGLYQMYEDTALSYSWYKMPSGSYEIVAYLT